MRVARTLVFAFLSFSLTLPALGRQASTTVQRDQQAIVLLTQCLDAAGGIQHFAAIQDFTASGTITYYWSGQEIQVPATARGRGTTQFRLDANSPDGNVSLAASQGLGSLKKADGSVTRLTHLNTLHLGSLTFPFSKLLAALRDSSVTVVYVDLANESGRQAHHIRVQKNVAADSDPRGLRKKASTAEFFIDAETLRLVKTLDWIPPGKRSTTIHRPHEVHFSDYRDTNGIAVPFVVSENIVGQRLWTLHLTEINFNVGLKDSDFAF